MLLEVVKGIDGNVDALLSLVSIEREEDVFIAYTCTESRSR